MFNKTRVKFSAKWAWTGVVLGLLAFIYNYTMVPMSLPGYEIIAAPAMFALSFFSEETPFWPKLSIFLLGQYIVYFIIIFVSNVIIHSFGRKR